jgi:hypothetical protein
MSNINASGRSSPAKIDSKIAYSWHKLTMPLADNLAEITERKATVAAGNRHLGAA